MEFEFRSIFTQIAESSLPYFPELEADLRRAGISLSSKEYLSKCMFLTALSFVVSLPLLSVVLTFFLRNFLFGFITSITASFFVISFFFVVSVNYPKILIWSKSKKIDSQLPFASVHLSTLASTKLPLSKIFEIFSTFPAYGEIVKETKRIVRDMRTFGIDVNTAIERSVKRVPSKNFKELLWGLLSTNLSGGDINLYLKEKARSFMTEYREKLRRFSHQLAIYIEIYLTAVILGAIFFIILTSIVAGMAGVGKQVLVLQFFLIFIFLPFVSAIFIYLVRVSSPGGS